MVDGQDEVPDLVQVTPAKGGPVAAKAAMNHLSAEPGADGVHRPTVMKTAMNKPSTKPDANGSRRASTA